MCDSGAEISGDDEKSQRSQRNVAGNLSLENLPLSAHQGLGGERGEKKSSSSGSAGLGTLGPSSGLSSEKKSSRTEKIVVGQTKDGQIISSKIVTNLQMAPNLG